MDRWTFTMPFKRKYHIHCQQNYRTHFFVCSPTSPTSLKQDEFTYEESAIIYQLLIFMPQTRTDYLPMEKKNKLVFPLN